ncbi:MAG: HAMP domain-containing protein [Leptospiraceae bacterium]|nr:HAMP domain-containing protein [Leptospiraceae bacterium]MCP5502711.1 HAMP domain-containing protein [Leptospiraceae bacterium]
MRSIKGRLIAGYSSIFILVLLTGLSGFFGINSISKKVSFITQEDTQFLKELAELRINILNLRRYEKDILLNLEDKNKVKSYYTKWEVHSKNSRDLISALNKRIRKERYSNSKNRDFLENIPSLFLKYTDNMQLLYSNISSDKLKNSTAANLSLLSSKEAIYSIEDGLDTVSKEINTTILQNDTYINSFSFSLSTLLIILTFLSLVICITISVTTYRSIDRPLSELLDTIVFISKKGILSKRVKNPGKDEIGEVSLALNTMLNILENLIFEMNKMSSQHDEGDIDVKIDITKFEGDYQIVAEGINNMVFGHIAVKKKAMACVKEFGEGNFDAPLETFPGKKAFINEIIEQVRSNLKTLIFEMNKMSSLHDEGDIDVKIPTESFKGDYKTMAEGINNMVFGHIAVKKKAMACVKEFGKGNFDAPLETFPGKKAFINEIIEQVRGNLKNLINDANFLSEAAIRGELEVRADANRHYGDFKRIIEGVNQTLDAVIKPLQESSLVLQELSHGNLDVSVDGTYHGDHAIIKNSLNATIDSFNELISEILNAAEQILVSSKQVADSSQSLSQGSTEQASSVDEITSTLRAIEEQANLNAKMAEDVSQQANEVKGQALKGNTEMKSMLTAMTEITETSENIAKIIKEIDAIAFQTNILALNAAVEAARAGQHGKGFNVVAEEVRNLASRSATAAKETAGLIEGAIKKVNVGTEIANRTAGVLNEMTEGVVKVSGLVKNIASASIEQSASVAESTTGVNQISEVAMNVAATAEESSAASIELASQAESFRNMVKRFKIKNSSAAGKRKIELH